MFESKIVNEILLRRVDQTLYDMIDFNHQRQKKNIRRAEHVKDYFNPEYTRVTLNLDQYCRGVRLASPSLMCMRSLRPLSQCHGHLLRTDSKG